MLTFRIEGSPAITVEQDGDGTRVVVPTMDPERVTVEWPKMVEYNLGDLIRGRGFADGMRDFIRDTVRP